MLPLLDVAPFGRALGQRRACAVDLANSRIRVCQPILPITIDGPNRASSPEISPTVCPAEVLSAGTPPAAHVAQQRSAGCYLRSDRVVYWVRVRGLHP